LKKLILGAVALAIAVAGVGTLGTQTVHADPTGIFVINENVKLALDPTNDCDLAVDATAACMQPLHDASAGQLGDEPLATGELIVVVLTDGSATPITLNGRGLVCDPVCDGTTAHPAPGPNRALWTIEDRGTVAIGDSVNITAAQDGVPLNATVSVVGVPHDMQISAAFDKTTIQEGAPSCGIRDSITHPTRAGVLSTVTDVQNRAIIGAVVEWETSNANVVDIAEPLTVSMQLEAGPVAAFNVACGENTGTANVTAITDVLGFPDLPRSLEFTVTGVPASVALTASPAAIPCDGVTSSTVTATVTDADGVAVVDGTNVNFSVVALGIANPINVPTEGGQASSQITPLSGATAGVTVIVTSGDAQSSILVACDDALLTPVDPVDPTPAPPIVPPTTGTGFTAQGGGFPLWTLLALAAAGIAVMGGGLVTRRAGQ
jgi:hypothetical protein